MSHLVYKKKFYVHTYEVSPKIQVRSDQLMNYLQEAANDHSLELKTSVLDLFPKGKTWVLSRYHLKIEKVPRLGQEIEVTTWPSGRFGDFLNRDFELRDAKNNEIMAKATSSWAIFDLKERCLVTPDEFLPKDFIHNERAIHDSFQSLPKVSKLLEKNPSIYKNEVEFKVMIRDLDLNNHVNHVVYVQWAMEAVPREELLHMRPYSLEISYHAEALYGEDIISLLAEDKTDNHDDKIFIHSILNKKTGKELARLRTKWSV